MREVMGVIQEELKDPRVGFITVIRAEVTDDLRQAKIYVSIFGTPEEQEETLKTLTRAAGFIRAQIGRRMRLRYLPEVVFKHDHSMQHVDRIFKILKDLDEPKSPKNESDL